MRFLVDECTGPTIANWLRTQNYDVTSIYDEARGADDETIIRKAYNENRILITNDRHFGEKIYRDHFPHRGVIFLRLTDERTSVKMDTLSHVLVTYGDKLADNFVVVTETRVRFAKQHG